MNPSKVNILAVDDKPENLFALENVLRDPELNIVTVGSGNEALAKLLEMEFACVIMDVQMPEMDGFELAKIIRSDEHTKFIPIIFSSGQQRADADVFKGYETGAVDYLLKPLDPVIVRGKIKVFADLFRKSAALKRAEASMAEYARQLKAANSELERRVADRMRELTDAQAQMAQLQKMDAIGSLAGGVAHDFNNVLAAINMYCDLTCGNIESVENVRESIAEIRIAASRGAALTRQLLIFSRKQIIQPKNLEINSVIRGTLNMLRRLIGENIEVETKFANSLGLICADSGQLEQVLLNLVVNARDAMPRGGKLTIETENVLVTKEFSAAHLNVTPGPHVVLSISDTGIGMDENTRAHLFEPFFTTKPVGKGTGLGLSTIYGIVKQSQGTIWIASEPGQGTVFKIYFPISKNAIPEPLERSEIRHKTRGGEIILIVEDDDVLRNLYGQALERHGYQVVVAANGKEALEAIKSQPEIGLLITDVIMPQMGGFELARKASEIRASLPILFMSGYTNEALEISDIGIDSILQKPFDTDTLVVKIQELLGQ